MQKTGIVIQARLGSSRLPNKMILPFLGNQGVLELLILRLKKHFHTIPIIVATTTSQADDELVEICKKCGVDYYRGSESNVLSRFIEVAEVFGLTSVVRVCADNPYLNMLDLGRMIEKWNELDVDYLSYQTSEGTPSIRTHYGLWGEVVVVEALRRVLNATEDPLYLEHVTNYVYSHPTDFKLEFIRIPKQMEEMGSLRTTLDTQEDFNLLKWMYSELGEWEGESVGLAQRIAEKKEWLEIMEGEILKNSK